MGKEKREYIPLHKRIQESAASNEKTMKDIQAKNDDLNIFYKEVFNSEMGLRVLAHMVDTRIGAVPAAGATSNEVMFAHGAASVVHEILKRIR